MIIPAFIVPTKFMDCVADCEVQMFSAVIATLDSKYAKQAQQAKGFKILDGGYYKLRKQPNLAALIRTASIIDASAIVLPDGDTSDESAIRVYQNGFTPIFVPLSHEDLNRVAVKLAESSAPREKSGILAISHLQCAKLLNAEPFNSLNRYNVLRSLKKTLSIKQWEKLSHGRIHLLGLGSYPLFELQMISQLFGDKYASIITCDSSAFLGKFIREKIRFDDVEVKHKGIHAISLENNYAEFANYAPNDEMSLAAVQDERSRIETILKDL